MASISRCKSPTICRDCPAPKAHPKVLLNGTDHVHVREGTPCRNVVRRTVCSKVPVRQRENTDSHPFRLRRDDEQPPINMSVSVSSDSARVLFACQLGLPEACVRKIRSGTK